MFQTHLVRVGTLGAVGRFGSGDGRVYRRGSRVVCRTRRGLEVGHVLSAVGSDGAREGVFGGGDEGPGDASERDGSRYDGVHDGVIVRGVTVADDLLLERLERNRYEALEACQQLLVEHGSPAVLLDAEQLFDGSALYFYFLGDVDPELENLVSGLADAYETRVQLSGFAEALSAGCGPDCGTESAAGGCGTSGGCSTCAVSRVCQSDKGRGA